MTTSPVEQQLNAYRLYADSADEARRVAARLELHGDEIAAARVTLLAEADDRSARHALQRAAELAGTPEEASAR